MNTYNAMPQQRTPQQASIDAKEAREAWEKGAELEVFYGQEPSKGWCKVLSLEPCFSYPHLFWRVAKPTPPVITPGKWRMRNGVVVEIAPQNCTTFPWTGASAQRSWTKTGAFHLTGEHDHPFDLISRVETKWRPWKPEEVPLGREARRKDDHNDRRLIVGVAKPEWAFEHLELLLPDGTYAPCGVEEVVG